MDMLSYLMGQNSAIKKGMKVEVVTELPDTGAANVIYLVPKVDTGDNDIFDEYLWVNDDWEHIGSTDIDLSNYYTKNEVFRLITDSMPFKLTSTSSFNNTSTTHYFYEQLIKQKVLSIVNTDAFYSSVFLYVTDVDNNVALIPAKRFTKNGVNYADGILFYNDGRMCFVRFAVGVGSDGTLTLHIETNPVTNANATKEYVDDITGTLSNLTTTDKTNLVNAINEIAGSSGGEQEVYLNASDANSQDSPFIFDGKNRGIYLFDSYSSDKIFYYKALETDTIKSFTGQVLYIELFKDVNYDELETNEVFGRCVFIDTQRQNLYRTNVYKGSTKTISANGQHICTLLSTTAQYIYGLKTFDSIPMQANTNAPTTDAQFTNKKYVDDSIASAITDALGGSY